MTRVIAGNLNWNPERSAVGPYVRPHAISAISRPHPRIVGPTPLYIRPELFIVEGAEPTRAPLINGEARHTRSRTTRGIGGGTRVRTDIVSRWRIIWRSVSRRFLGVDTHIYTGIKGVSLLTYRGMYPRPGNLAVFPGNATGVLILCTNVSFDFSILMIINFYKSVRFDLKMKN